ncbi:hypothetical protein [Winogradskyella sp.]|uniref:hypothetical protein n=1 Tax=Winogradskyella sp. TaxID=1883156 RepID=UPI003F6B41E2
MIDRLFFIFWLLFISFQLAIAQENNAVKKRFYVPKEHFKDKYQAKDSLGFRVFDGDTLIRVSNYVAPKGVAVEYEYKDSTFLELYKKLAFRTIHKDSANTKPMKYWKQPIKIFFSKSVSKNVKKEILRFTETIDNAVDSLSIMSVKKLEDSNYIIYHDSDYHYDNNLKNYKNSSYWLYWNNKNQITQSNIRILKSKIFSDKLEIQKIKELFFGSLGWFTLSNELDCESYFANCYSDNKRLTILDIELLKYHYSYGICKGTRLKTFEEQHKACKDRLKNGHPAGMFIHSD